MELGTFQKGYLALHSCRPAWFVRFGRSARLTTQWFVAGMQFFVSLLQSGRICMAANAQSSDLQAVRSEYSVLTVEALTN